MPRQFSKVQIAKGVTNSAVERIESIYNSIRFEAKNVTPDRPEMDSCFILFAFLPIEAKGKLSRQISSSLFYWEKQEQRDKAILDRIK